MESGRVAMFIAERVVSTSLRIRFIRGQFLVEEKRSGGFFDLRHAVHFQSLWILKRCGSSGEHRDGQRGQTRVAHSLTKFYGAREATGLHW